LVIIIEWFTWADMHSLMFVSCFCMYGYTFDNNSKNCSRYILKWFLYISRSSLVHSTNNLFDAPNVSRLIIHGLTHQRHFFLLFLFSKICLHSFIKQAHVTTTPSCTSSFVAILKSTASFTRVELCKQYRSLFWMKASRCAWKSISITQTYVSTIYLSFNRWIQFHWFNRVDQPGGPV